MKKDPYGEIKKVIRVVRSCTKPGHCDTAMTYVRLFLDKHNLGTKKNMLLLTILAHLVEYLQDTREHAERGYHKPGHTQWNTVTTYPRLSDYLGHLKIDINWDNC